MNGSTLRLVCTAALVTVAGWSAWLVSADAASSDTILNGNCFQIEPCQAGCIVHYDGTTCIAQKCTGGTGTVVWVCQDNALGQNNCTVSQGDNRQTVCTGCQKWVCAKNGAGECTSLNAAGTSCRCPATGGIVTGDVWYRNMCT
jgi:hypothetical protein